MPNIDKQPVWWWWYTPEEATKEVNWVQPEHLQKWHNTEKKTDFYMLSYNGLLEADRIYWNEQNATHQK